jgi:hypothetical protein
MQTSNWPELVMKTGAWGPVANPYKARSGISPSVVTAMTTIPTGQVVPSTLPRDLGAGDIELLGAGGDIELLGYNGFGITTAEELGAWSPASKKLGMWAIGGGLAVGMFSGALLSRRGKRMRGGIKLGLISAAGAGLVAMLLAQSKAAA